MIAESGHYALVLALALALIQSTVPVLGARLRDPALMGVARSSAIGQLLFAAAAFAALVTLHVTSDFSVVNVFENSHSLKPMIYKVTGVWGNHEGSMLLWVSILALFGGLVAIFGNNLPLTLRAHVLAVQAWIASAFYLFMLMTSNPFLRIANPPIEGRDLNPILQDIGLAVHPPMLYLGYVGFSISFSFAIAALLEGRIDAAWARWVRPWTLVAWIFLTLGIAMGSYWAYYELGWGGWWFWDPVENASLMPWLAGTALLHSALVMEKRNALKVWTILLSILTFSLSLLGTFLVRSGVLTSVHAFASDPTRGVFILLILCLFIGGSLALFAGRASTLKQGDLFAPISREGALVLNNLFLTAFMFTVLTGTLFPLVAEAIKGVKVSVGEPFFNRMSLPIIVTLLFLMGVGPLARWRKAQLPEIAARLKWAMGVSVVCAIAVPLIQGRWSIMVAFGVLLAAWILSSSLVNLWSRLRPSEGGHVGTKLASLPRGYLGMLMAHIGVAAFVTGITLVKGYEVEKDVRMDVGDTVAIGPYSAKFTGTSEGDGPNYKYLRGQFEIYRGDKLVRTMLPEKHQFANKGEPMTDAAIAPGIAGDLYVSMGEPVSPTAWVVRVYFKPFVDWIWGGCLMMALGGVLALSDRRYRLAQRAGAPASFAGAAAPGA